MSADMVGEALVPYYRQILPVFSIFRAKNCAYRIPLQLFYSNPEKPRDAAASGARFIQEQRGSVILHGS